MIRIPNAPPDMKIRLSADLRRRIETAARNNNRTMNAEIGARLEQSFREKSRRAVSAVQSPDLEERLKKLEGRLVDLLLKDPFDTLPDRVSALEKRIKEQST
jgi:hypothetical protein